MINPGNHPVFEKLLKTGHMQRIQIINRIGIINPVLLRLLNSIRP